MTFILTGRRPKASAKKSLLLPPLCKLGFLGKRESPRKFMSPKKSVVLFLILGAFCLFFLGCAEKAETAVPKLITQLRSKDTRERNKAALALASYGKKAEPATSALITLLDDPNGGVQSSAAYALNRIGTEESTKAVKAHTAKRRR